MNIQKDFIFSHISILSGQKTASMHVCSSHMHVCVRVPLESLLLTELNWYLSGINKFADAQVHMFLENFTCSLYTFDYTASPPSE